jgi:hypothetical protein
MGQSLHVPPRSNVVKKSTLPGRQIEVHRPHDLEDDDIDHFGYGPNVRCQRSRDVEPLGRVLEVWSVITPENKYMDIMFGGENGSQKTYLVFGPCRDNSP